MIEYNVSACMIVRDGESTIRKALESVRRYADEIVVGIDSRTTDNTRDIVAEFTDKYFEFDWINDFAYARNLVASKASYDFILVLDADDCIEQGKEKIFKDALNDNTVVNFTIKFAENSSLVSCRCYNRNDASYVYKVHEYLKFNCFVDTVIVPITITHEKGKIIEPGRNLKILDTVIKEYPRYLFYHGRECYDSRQFDRAIESFTRYIEQSSWIAEKCEAFMGKARSYAALNKFDEAKRECFAVMMLDGNFMPAYNYVGQICSVNGDFAQAIMWYEMALKCSNTNYVFNEVEDIKFNCYGNLILAYHRCGRINDARTALNQAERIKNGDEWIKRQIELTKLE